MPDELDPLAVARKPTQKRALERFARVLDEAEALLVAEGLAGVSIPVIADKLGYTRGSVYAYFPTPYAILNELAQRYLAELLVVFAHSDGLVGLPWRKGIENGVAIASDYYDAHPAARLIILGGAVTDYSFRAQELTIKRVGALGRLAWQQRGIVLPSEEPDVAALAIDLGMSCLRRSVFEHGEVTPAYRVAASNVMVAFLEPYIEGSS
jgi:AcrR family transcriptional regulator